MRPRWRMTACLAAIALQAVAFSGCGLESAERKPRHTLFIGVDTSGSFEQQGRHDDAMKFLAHYIYGHLNNLGGLEQPRELFVAAIGGENADEPKAFHPIQDFAGKEIPEIEQALREWFSPNDALTDFNPFFQQVARIVKERNLILAPVTLMIVTDGVPDFSHPGARRGSEDLYKLIDLSSLEYLTRKLTLRLAYVSPQVGQNWREHVPRQRVRLWTIDEEIMKGWTEHVAPSQPAQDQGQLWEWIQHNVDYRVRAIRT